MGATLVLDARRLTGLSDGQKLAVWTDLSGNGYDASQGAAENQPSYRVNIQGGQPAVSFDGNDSLRRIQNLSAVNAISLLVACSFANTTARLVVCDVRNMTPGSQSFAIEQNSYLTAGSRYGMYAAGSSNDSGVATSPGFKIISVAANTTSGNSITASTTYRVQGITSVLTNLSGSNSFSDMTAVSGFVIGSFNDNGANYHWMNGEIGQVIVLPGLITGAAIKRLEHASAYSYKIACS
jgi:hypothetical protein